MSPPTPDPRAPAALRGARLLLIGPGYCARRFLARVAGSPAEVAATARDTEAAARLSAEGIRPVRFNGDEASPELAAAIHAATHILVSIPPSDGLDWVVEHHDLDLMDARDLRAVVYLSSIGVYGNHQGGWVDETTPENMLSARASDRRHAERLWQTYPPAPVAILRLAGIYGPGRNALAGIAAGTARSIVKPGQVFNRIHVDDVAAAIGAAFAAHYAGIVNVTDDEPASSAEVNGFAARLMGVPPPAEIPFEQAVLSPMARSFYDSNKRVRNDRLKTDLGVRLAFPTYREGLAALWQRGEWRANSP